MATISKEINQLTSQPATRSMKRYSTQILATFAANLSAFSYGCVWSWTATALPSLKQEGHNNNSFGILTHGQQSMITSIVYLGSLVAAPMTGFILSKFGRRQSLILLNPALIIGWLLIAFAKSIPMLYVGRFVTGMCAGGLATLSPIFISEISQAEIRGMLVCTFDPAMAAGMLYVYIIGSYTSWHIQTLACILIPIIAFSLLIIVEESPRYLLTSGKYDICKVEEALSWYRPGSHVHDENDDDSNNGIQVELNEMYLSVEEHAAQAQQSSHKNCNWMNILKMSIVKPTLIGMMLISFHMASGNYAILANTVSIFRNAGVDDEYLATTLVGVAQLFGSIGTLFFIEKCGRRSLLMFSESIVALTLVGLGIYFYFKKLHGEEFDWFPLGMFMIYEIAFSIGIGPIPFLMMGELLPPNAKGISATCMSATESLMGFLILYQFTDLMALFGQDVGYWFFAAISLISIIFTYFFVPETKGKTLEEIHSIFSVKKSKFISIKP